MLNRVIIIFALLFLPWAANGKIIETAHIADVIPLIDEETWALVDLDNTMFEGKQALGHADWFYDELQKGLEKGYTREEIFADFYPKWTETQKRNSVKPLEEDFVSSLQMLQNRGIVVMGLTHRQPSIANHTIRQVSSLGFDFTITAPSKDTFSVAGSKYSTLMTKGILFVNDFNKKGDVLIGFLGIIKKMPKKVVFIDDKRKNVEDLEQTLSLYGVDYIGVHYTAILNVKPIYSREIAEFQYKYLEKILSNEAAQILMEKGLD